MADKNIMFRTSVSGFNKADVTAYVDKQNADFRELTEKMNAALSGKDAEIASLRSEINELKKKDEEIAALQAELDGYKQKAAEFEKKSGSSDPAELSAKLSEAESRIAEKEAEIERLKTEAAAKGKESERKAVLYDDMSAQLGDIIITANKSADGILSDARAEAEKIKEQALADANEFRSNFTARMARISAELRSNTRTAEENYKNEISSGLEDMRKLLTETIKAVDEKSALFSAMSDRLQSRLDSEVETASAETDKEAEILKKGI